MSFAHYGMASIKPKAAVKLRHGGGCVCMRGEGGRHNITPGVAGSRRFRFSYFRDFARGSWFPRHKTYAHAMACCGAGFLWHAELMLSSERPSSMTCAGMGEAVTS